MRRFPPLLALAVGAFVSCRGVPDTDAEGVAAAVDAAVHDEGGFVVRSWTAPCGVGAVSRCEAADSAWRWRELRAAVPELGSCELRVDFAGERLVVAVVPQAGLAPPVAFAHHREEDVDVLELTPAPGRPADAGVVHVLVVPATQSPLAIVLRTPAVDGRTVERTLAAFPARGE
jgi:hypothetical protein